ncbi:papain-like cysteine protease family protein [Streptomyces sp. NPDC047042]|uniref:papain-like cysteine protease family protein n=1 Tax=Streptomyces sp. NPDC047042 TaxID=3154807 RepID=UPI0033E0194B
MIILQRSISRDGAAAESMPVEVTVEVPATVFTTGPDREAIRTTGETSQSASFVHTAGDDQYQVALPETVLTGPTDDSATAAALFFRAALTAGDTDALTLPVRVRYRSLDGQWLGEQAFDVLAMAKLSPDADREGPQRPHGVRSRTAYFLVNKRKFLALREQLAVHGADFPLAALLSYLTQLVDGVPGFADADAEKITSLLRDQSSVRDADRLVQALGRAHSSLVDNPLTIPEPKTLTVAGTLTVNGPPENALSARDFAPFDVCAEWTDTEGRPRAYRFRFDTDIVVTDRSAPFELTDSGPFYSSAVLADVRVSVHGLDGSTLWSRSLRPDDPALAELRAVVPAQTPTTLVRPDAPPHDANLRLRGRVVVFNRDCAVKDILVLVQVRNADDQAWRAVGAAKADSAGNFTMPYPYGTHAQARAVCSVAPDDPVEIPVVASDGDRTISADFLYLLVRNPRASDGPCSGDDCGCGTAESPRRLPDHSDLIGSDTYSQDIGGSCVNLSTPNRTINEFAFQAVVRTSDPDVATCRLTRKQTGLASLDVSQVAALATGAAALHSRAVTALLAARQGVELNAGPSAATVLKAVEAVQPHVLAVASAFTADGPPITLSALAAAREHIASLVSTLRATRDQAAVDGFGFPPEAAQTISAAEALQPLVGQAVDTVGTSVHYELTGATTTRVRRPVGLHNPIEWQNAPETPDPPATASPLPFPRWWAASLGSPGSPSSPASPLWPRVPSVPHLSRPQTDPVQPADLHAEFSQAVSVATGHILHYKVLFKADGYSLGDLVYSLPLAPGQKKEIAVFEASRTLAGAEAQQLAQDETLAMGLVNERNVTSLLAGGIDESLRGNSRANTSGVSYGFGAAGQGSGGTGAYGGSGGVVIGVAGGTSQASSNAQQDGSRDVAQFFSERLRQSIMQNAEAYRQLNASVVTSVQQSQRYGVTSEVIANHNHCHSLTMMYFEVLRHYALFHELASVEECVFVPLPLARFSVENIAAWRDVLAPALLPMPSDTYLQPSTGPTANGRRQHPLLPAFDAVQRLRTAYANVDFPAASYDEEPVRFLSGRMQLRVALPRPKTRYDRVKSLPVISKTVVTDRVDVSATLKSTWVDGLAAGLTGGLSLLFTGPPGSNIEYKTAQVEGRKALFDAFMTLDANYESVPPARCMRVKNFDPVSITANGVTVTVSGLDFFQDGQRDREQWELYGRLLGYSDVLDMLTYYFGGRLISEWDDIFYQDIAPLVFDRIINSVRLSDFAVDTTASSRYTGGERLIEVTLSGTTSKRRNQLPDQLLLDVTSATARALRGYVTLNVENVRLDYATAHYRGPLYAGGLRDGLLDGVRLDVPLRPDEKRNPRREDRYLVSALVEHLNNNLEHYNKLLWSRLDPDRRYMLLDGFGIQVFHADGTPVPGPAGLRSLASVVKNEVVTVAGNSLVLPVAPGYRVSGSFVRATVSGEDAPVSLLDHYQPLTPVEPYRISVPTRGVFTEAVMGACNACEKVETDRLQDWSRFGLDATPTIEPVTLPTPALDEWKAAFKDFAAPMVNVQNAPAVPEPGAGLAGLSGLLANSGVFRDLTGLDANQQNAIRTYLSNQENAKGFAEMAKEMATQRHNTQNSGRIMDSITAAKNSGAISQEDQGRLVKDHLRQQIDGGAGRQAEAEAEGQKTATPLSQAAVRAVAQGKDVTASRLDSSGNSESVTIRGTASSRVLAEVSGTVPHLRQRREEDCWAVAAAMMAGWKENRPDITPLAVVSAAGRTYRDIYLADTGLYAEDKNDFVLRVRMVAEPPASYRLGQYVDWLQTYGPLWVTTDGAPGQQWSPHARVLIRIAGTGTEDGHGTYFTFIDPSTGSEATTEFAEFVRDYEAMVHDSPLDVRPRSQVVHFIEGRDKTEGFQIEGPFGIHEPIHELVTLAALSRSDVPVPRRVRAGTHQPTNEFCRGVIWNDDPAILLFDEDPENNWKFTTGVCWSFAFKRAGRASVNDRTNLTGRSHYFDLQFLHAMAERAGEPPWDTLAQIMLWAEVMYRLSIGDGLSGDEQLAAVPVTSRVVHNEFTYSYALSRFFDGSTRPKGTDTLRHLLTLDSAYGSVDLGRRAMGSLLHLVQDSYARGHVKRTLLNPEDLLPGRDDAFKSGTHGRYGGIETFHCYSGQDSDAHNAYDKPAGELPHIEDITSFDPLIGARDAVAASRTLLNMWHAQTPWDAPGGPKEYLESTVFMLAPTATHANPDV